MHRFLAILLGIGLLVPTLVFAAPAQAPHVRTVYGQGPELHLLPNYGNVGSRIQVYGLGYRPGARVQIRYGAPGASYMPRPLATVIASSNGTFHTTFTVTCALWIFKSGQPSSCALTGVNPVRLVIIGAFANGQFTHKKTASLGFVVTSAPPVA